MNRTLVNGRNELVVKLYESGKTPEKIAEIVGCCTDNVYKILRASGVEFRFRKFTNEQLTALLNEGKSMRECARILGVIPSTIYGRVKRMQNPVRETICETDVHCMQRLRENGYTNEQIAQRMGVNRLTVYRHIGTQPKEISDVSFKYACEVRKLKVQRRNNAKAAMLRRKQEEEEKRIEAERIEAERRAAEEAARREKEALEKNRREIFDTILSIGFPQELATSASSTIETAAQGAAILENMKKRFSAAPTAVH